MIRTRNSLAAAVIGALALAACGGDDAPAVEAPEPAAEEEMSEEEMSDEEMSEEEMSGEEMSDEEMSGEEMSGEEMSGEEMSDEEMSDEEMSDEEMSGEEMSGEEMSGEEMSGEEMSGEEMSEEEMSGEEMSGEASMNDLMSRISARSDLTVLDEAIHAADLQDTFHADGPFTIFAPTDAAFDAYLGEMGMSAGDVLADTAALTALLQAHVVAGSDDSTMVMDMAGQSFTTLAGTELAVTADGETVMVGDATVVEYDVAADNGVIHVIDTVLMPAG